MTNENSNFNILIRQAVRNCVEDDFKEFRTGDVSDITVHPRIRRKVKLKIRRMVLQSSMGWQILKRSIVSFLVIVTVAFASAMCIQPIRAAFWNAVITWYEEYIAILLVAEEDEYPKTIQERKFPEIPDGWELTIVRESDANGLYEITGPDGEYIAYNQRVYMEFPQGYDNTGCSIQEIILNDYVKAYLLTYHLDNAIVITWLDQYEYTLTGDLENKEKLIEMAISIQ